MSGFEWRRRMRAEEKQQQQQQDLKGLEEGCCRAKVK